MAQRRYGHYFYFYKEHDGKMETALGQKRLHYVANIKGGQIDRNIDGIKQCSL